MIHARRETHVRVFTFEYRVEIEIEEAFCISHILCKFSIYYSLFIIFIRVQFLFYNMVL